MPRPRGETGYGQRAPKETWKDRTQGPLGTDSFGAKTAQRAHYAVTMAELSQAMDRPGAVAALTNAGPEAYRYWTHLAQEVGRTAEVPPAKACSADSSAPSDQNVSVEPKEETNDGPEETEKTADSESTAQASGNQRTADRDERNETGKEKRGVNRTCLLYTSPSPRDRG